MMQVNLKRKTVGRHPTECDICHKGLADKSSVRRHKISFHQHPTSPDQQPEPERPKLPELPVRRHNLDQQPPSSSTQTISTQREQVREVQVGLKHCSGVCKYHRLGYVTPCSSFTFGTNQRWEYSVHCDYYYQKFGCTHYTHSFDCNSRNVLYILQCNNCNQFYIGETEDLKKRIYLHVSNITHPRNSNCSKLSTHLNHCAKMQHPYFKIYPFFFSDNRQQRRFFEKKFIESFQPTLNSDER